MYATKKLKPNILDFKYKRYAGRERKTTCGHESSPKSGIYKIGYTPRPSDLEEGYSFHDFKWVPRIPPPPSPEEIARRVAAAAEAAAKKAEEAAKAAAAAAKKEAIDEIIDGLDTFGTSIGESIGEGMTDWGYEAGDAFKAASTPESWVEEAKWWGDAFTQLWYDGLGGGYIENPDVWHEGLSKIMEIFGCRYDYHNNYRGETIRLGNNFMNNLIQYGGMNVYVRKKPT